MSTLLETFTLDQLTPAQRPEDARQDACQFGASLTITKGQAIAIKTSDAKAYPLATTSAANEVQTMNWTNSPAGTFRLRIKDSNGVFQDTQPITYSGTAATLVSNLQTATDAVLGTNAIVWSGSAVTAIAGTFSGVNYAGLPQPNILIDTDALTAGDVDITRTTDTTDGTQNFKGFSMYSFSTDANGKCYFGTAGSTAGYRTPPWSTAPIWIAGIFDPQDLTTRTTPVAEVDTFTASSPTTGDVYTITITYPDYTTYPVSAIVGATQTATAIDTLLKAAWAADATAAAYATASGTATLIFTSAIPGNAMNLSGSVVGTGTIAKVVTTPAVGRTIADIQGGAPGARVLHNGFWKF